ncbi:lysoplasmalogenase [Rhodobacterales bacterium 56_14_T64]|mgnify:CR=1 FL=1|nr:lysoplasmalogenase [Rhodobacterales bacterium 56_14_T64]
MALEHIPLIAAALCALSYLWQTGQPQGPLRSTVKTAAVALLALAAGLAGAPLLLVLALATCAVGDFCLSRDGERVFMAGVGAFALGQLGYIVLFLAHPDSAPMRLLHMPHLILALALVGVGIVMSKVLAPRAGALKGPVLVYIPIILGMGLAALSLPGQGALIWLMPAALVFILSDLVLAAETFVLPPSHPARRYTPSVVWVTYWSAQLGFFTTFA